jgi:hypothetical protein
MMRMTETCKIYTLPEYHDAHIEQITTLSQECQLKLCSTVIVGNENKFPKGASGFKKMFNIVNVLVSGDSGNIYQFKKQLYEMQVAL